jgi:hypothetical protein
MPIRTHNLTQSALFIALGVLVPFLFHTVGLGKMFLPMFWPIAASAFFLPTSYSMAVGALTPILSSLSTGMPPPPILYKMIAELALFAGTIGMLYRKTSLGIFWLVLSGLFISEIVTLLSAAAIAPMIGLPPELYAIASFIESIPGVVVVMIMIPLIIKKAKGEPIFATR